MKIVQVEELIHRLRNYDESLAMRNNGPKDDSEYDKFADMIESDFNYYCDHSHECYEDIFADIRYTLNQIK